MSVQLVLYPQNHNGEYNSITTIPTEFAVNGINFVNLDTASSYDSANILNANILAAAPPTIVNTWFRFRYPVGALPALPTVTSGAAVFNSLASLSVSGIYQRMSNLAVGQVYTININVSTTGVGSFGINIFDGNTLIDGSGFTAASAFLTTTFTATATDNTFMFFYSSNTAGNVAIEDISIQAESTTPSITLSDGQVICDLYEDEDIPLTLSIDDFKNAAEKVQSYSKAFKLPGTKRNNKIFDNIFEITRSDDGIVFNPYRKMQCILKQDGFVLFEGYVRLIDIQDQEGEISYNVNLYSEVVALADVLKDKSFNDIDFFELQHLYNVDNIEKSWNDTGVGITYTSPSTSGFRDANNTLKYPLVDWTHDFWVGNNNGINFTSIADIFRPFINIKYLIDKIFKDTPFTYESSFFNEANFLKLYMDFNWGSDVIPNTANILGFFGSDSANAPVFAGTAFTNLTIPGIQTGPSPPVPPDYNTATNTLTSTTANSQYNIIYSYEVKNTDTVDRDVEFRILSAGQVLDYTGVITLAAGQSYTYAGDVNPAPLAIGETLELQYKASAAAVIRQINYSVYWIQSLYTFQSMLNGLRGELAQWDFLKGIITMFNLVSIPDKSNPNNIFIEPYSDAFLSSNDAANPNFFDNNSTKLDWTDKIDISEMKLTPLTDLNKHTVFKFVEDDDDYAFSVYKNSVQGHLYGSKAYDASGFNILEGEKEIVAAPFAATVVKPLEDIFPDFIIPSLYSHNPDDETNEGIDNSPRIMFNNGLKNIATFVYNADLPNGSTGFLQVDEFLQFSHLTDIPTVVSSPPAASDTIDFNFGECQYLQGVGDATSNNLFNFYWLPYFNELYNPDTRTMSLKVNLSPGDLNTFNMYDTVFIKNREFRVNKIDYKPNDLATVEFILII